MTLQALQLQPGWGKAHLRIVQYSAKHYSTVQYSVQYSALCYGCYHVVAPAGPTVPARVGQGALEDSTVHCRTLHYNTVRSVITLWQLQALQFQPGWGKAHSRIGAALFGLKRYEEAVEAYRRAAKAEPKSATYKEAMEQVCEEHFSNFFLGVG